MKVTGRFLTNTYDFGGPFYVDIMVDYWSHTVDAYIFHSQCGIKMHMFGNSLDDISYEEFEELVDFNYLDYVEYYREDYML